MNCTPCTGSRIGILYGLPKIHKPNMPLRPILSSVNHYSYKLAKFFIPLLTPLTISPFIISDSFSFVQKLLNSDIDTRNVFMASFDVVLLFTNIPVNETIEIISIALFSDHQFFHGLDRSEFEKLLSLPVKNCHFIFDGRQKGFLVVDYRHKNIIKDMKIAKAVAGASKRSRANPV